MDEEYQEKGKLMQKIQQYPAVPIGLVGLIGIVTYNLYKFKNRGNISPSVYLIHMRLAGQGTVVGALTLTILYAVGQKLWKKFDGNK